MTQRHYGLRWTKRPRTNTKASAGESAMPFVVGIVAMMIVLGLVLVRGQQDGEQRCEQHHISASNDRRGIAAPVDQQRWPPRLFLRS